MAIQKLYTVGGNLATLYNGATALGWNDPDWYYRLYGNGVDVTAKQVNGRYTNTFKNLAGTDIEIRYDNAKELYGTFNNCTALSGIKSNSFNNVTRIGQAFENCTALSAIPDNCFNAVEHIAKSYIDSNTGTFNAVTSVGNNCFNSLTSFYVDYDQYLHTALGCFANLKSIGNDSFNGTINNSISQYIGPDLPLNLTSFGSGCFNGVLGWFRPLDSTDVPWFPSGVTSIPEHCFEAFEGGGNAFADSNLVTFPITSFPNLTGVSYMFQNCTALTIDAIDFIERHSNIEGRFHWGCFEGCTALTNYEQATAQYPTWFGIST